MMPEDAPTGSGAELPSAAPGSGSSGGSGTPPAPPEPPRPPPVDPCAFCLEPLDSASLVLPCGHSFHSICALQFLLKRKQCITCRAPVDETRVTDLTQLPQASGRSFVQFSAHAGSASPQPGSKEGGGAGGSPGRIELQAVAGRTAGAASPAVAAGLGAAAAAAAGPGGQEHVSREHTWNSPLAAASLAHTQSEGGGGNGGGAAAAAAAAWLPDISLLSAPPRSPRAGGGGLGRGVATPAAAAAVAAAAAAAEEGRAQETQQPMRTITVVRPQHRWVRPLFIGLLVLGLLTVIVVVPVLLGGREPPTSWDRRTQDEVEADCWLCLISGGDAFTCRDCSLAYPNGTPAPPYP